MYEVYEARKYLISMNVEGKDIVRLESRQEALNLFRVQTNGYLGNFRIHEVYEVWCQQGTLRQHKLEQSALEKLTRDFNEQEKRRIRA